MPHFCYLCGIYLFLGQNLKNVKKKIAIEELIVTQSNPLIEAIYPRLSHNAQEIEPKMTTQAHKASRLIVSLINPNDGDLRLYKVEIDTLKSYLGYKKDFPNGRFYQDLRDIATRLNKQPIEIRPEPKRILTAYFLSSFEINFKTGEVIFEISGQLKPFLMQLKNNFTSFDLQNIPRLSSGYSIRLYELLCQYKPLGKRIFDDLDRLQKMLGSSYDKYSHFKARVLESTKADIAKNTNIKFEYEEVKTGKKVTKLIFHIYDNTPENTEDTPQLTLNLESIDLNPLVAILQEVGLREKDAEKYAAQGFDIVKNTAQKAAVQARHANIADYYIEKIALAKASKTSTDNLAGFVVKALQEDWQKKTETPPPSVSKPETAQKKAQNQIKQLETQIRQLEKQYADTLAPIYATLAADEKLFEKSYQNVLNSYAPDSIFRQNLREFGTSKAAYAENAALNALMNAQFKEIAPAAFASTNTLADKIRTLKQDLKEIINYK